MKTFAAFVFVVIAFFVFPYFSLVAAALAMAYLVIDEINRRELKKFCEIVDARQRKIQMGRL